MAPENPPNPRRPFTRGATPPPPAASTGRPVVHRRPTPPPPVVAYEDVVAACGHPEKFGLFEDRKDKFRNDRRKKVTDRPCKACREKKRIEEEAAIQARHAEKAARAAEAAKLPRPAKSKPPSDHSQRLPDGAKFEVTYDATKMQWSGTLTIGDKVFNGSAGGVFNLLNRLDRYYRQSLPAGASQESAPAQG